jgi:EmrB/QacA subfamily drug resistance transporter
LETLEKPEASNQRYSLPKRQVVLTMAGVMLGLLLASLDQTIVGTAMPRIITELGGFSQYTWVVNAYLIATVVTVLIAGKLSDLYGRKWVLTGGIGIFIVGSILCGFSDTMNELIVFRGLQGVGAGAIMGLTFIIIGDLFPPAERGKYVGLLSGVFGISSVIGPTLGGFITDNFSWNWVFFINIPLGIIIVLLFIFFFPHLRPIIKKPKIDYAGIVTLILAVVPLMIALSWAGVDYEWGSPVIVGMFAFSIVMLLLFIWVESRSDEPIMPLWIFKNRIVSISSIAVFTLGFGMFTAIIFIPLYFQGVLGTTATASGNFLTPMMLGVVVGAVISGQLLSRAGGHYRIQGIAGISLMALGLFLLTRMTVDTTSGTAVINIVITGLGLGITMPLYLIAVQNAVPHSVLGIATSTNAFFRTLGGAFGLAIAGSVLNRSFLTEFTDKLPNTITDIIPQEQLSAIADNPQALVSPEAQTQLQAVFAGLGEQGIELYNNLVITLREALNTALSNVFLVGLVVILFALAASLFIKQIPLRKHNNTDV